MRLTYIAALFGAAVAAPVLAQDPPPPAGFRIEAVGGYDLTKINGDMGGAVFGLGAGYDFRVGRRGSLGIEAEAADSTLDGCEFNLAQAGDSFCTAAGRDLYVGARAGIWVGNNVQLYARAGYTNARFRTTYDDGVAGSAGDLAFSQNLDGVRIGAGAQLRLGRHAYLGAEYRYSNYEGGGDRSQAVGTLGFRF
jgi:outer membrane immunogenic protein